MHLFTVLGAAGVGSRLVTEFSLGSAPRRPCCGGAAFPTARITYCRWPRRLWTPPAMTHSREPGHAHR